MSKQINKLDKAASLFRLGYRAHIRNGVIIVRKIDGTEYEIDAEAKTCTCRYAGTCSHLLGLLPLMLDTSNALDVRALDHQTCDRGCWGYSEQGRALATRARALSDAVARLRVGFEVWAAGLEERRAA